MLTIISLFLLFLSIIAFQNGVFRNFLKKIFSKKIAKKNYRKKHKFLKIIKEGKVNLLLRVAINNLKIKTKPA